MKKRFLCLGLCLVMLLGVMLAGCSTDTEDTSPSDGTTTVNRNAMTVTIAMSKGEGTTDEAAQKVEDAINVITESKLNTHVELYLYEKDELKDAIVKKVNEIGNLLENGENLAAEEVDEEKEDIVIGR